MKEITENIGEDIMFYCNMVFDLSAYECSDRLVSPAYRND